jgi:hypothetical protein
MSDSFNWTGLLGAAQKAHNDPLYSALLGAQGAGNSKAALGFLGNANYNPQVGDYGQGNRPGFQSSNPNYISPKGWGMASAGGGGGGGGGAPDPQGINAFHDFLKSDWWHDFIPDVGAGDAVATAGQGEQDALHAALARKQITQQGYNAAEGTYNTNLDSAKNYAASYLPGKLTEGRQALDAIVAKAGDSIQKDKANFQWSDYLDQLHNSANSFNSSIGSNLSSALAGQGFFSLPAALQSAGRAQGLYNPPVGDDLLKALMSQTGGGGSGGVRAVGNQGSF